MAMDTPPLRKRSECRCVCHDGFDAKHIVACCDGMDPSIGIGEVLRQDPPVFVNPSPDEDCRHKDMWLTSTTTWRCKSCGRSFDKDGKLVPPDPPTPNFELKLPPTNPNGYHYGMRKEEVLAHLRDLIERIEDGRISVVNKMTLTHTSEFGDYATATFGLNFAEKSKTG